MKHLKNLATYKIFKYSLLFASFFLQFRLVDFAFYTNELTGELDEGGSNRPLEEDGR